VGHALGLAPPVNTHGEAATQPTESGVNIPVIYHDGPVMNKGVTVHVIFWTPPGFPFQGAPPTAPTYEGLIKQYYTDVAKESEKHAKTNIFSTLVQYGEGISEESVNPGAYNIKFEEGKPNDVIKDEHPYPEAKCASPQQATACITDEQLQTEVK